MRALFVSELLGADYSEHNILHNGIGLEEAVRVLKTINHNCDNDLDPTKSNPGKHNCASAFGLGAFYLVN